MADPNAMDIDASPVAAHSAVTPASGAANNGGTGAGMAVDADHWPNAKGQSSAAGWATSMAPNGQPLPAAGPSRVATISNPHATLISISNDHDIREVPRMARTGYVYDPLMMLHAHESYTPTPDNAQAGDDHLHPEEPMRIKRIFALLKSAGLIRRMKSLPSKEVTMDQVALVHNEEHWMKVHQTEAMTDEEFMNTKAYYEGLSLVIQACRAVCENQVRNAFAIVRPPGHHAEPDEHMGFCFFNNVAVAARAMQTEGLAKKVLILDWDVHHGNGTQRAFWDDDSVLYISLHRHDGGKFYPSSDFGALEMVGVGRGAGKSVNIPWPSHGFGDADYIYAFQHIVMPIAYEFNPDLVIISAGFDAAEGDQLGQCNVTPAGYGHMTHMLSAVAGGKMVVALEGGYNLDAISVSAHAVAQVLLGETPERHANEPARDLTVQLVHDIAKVQSKYWKSINVRGCEPPEIGSSNDASVVNVADLLKMARANHLLNKYDLCQIPLANEDMDEAYKQQVFCTSDLYGPGSDTIVLFVHDFGNLRVEQNTISSSDVNMSKSYLIDTSDAVLNWVLDNKWKLIDVNVLRQLPTAFARDAPKMVSNRGDKNDGQLLNYLWNNFIELSDATNVVLIGHGTGCQALMELVNHSSVDNRVKAVVQVGGLHSLVRVDPTNEKKRNWFRDCNRVYVPSIHPLLSEERLHRRVGDRIFTSPKAKVVDVLVDVLPDIKKFVEQMLPKASPEPRLNGQAPARVRAVS